MEYKFRGKHNLSGEWVYGNPVEGVFRDTMIQSKDESGFLSTVVVDKESVGMVLCLKDKNDKNISQGDIILRIQHIGGNWIDRKFERFVVAYNPSIAGFEYKPIDGKEYKQYTVRPFGGEEVEIIGNIHDNPELLNPLMEGVLNMTDPNVKTEEEVKAPTETEQEQVPGEATEG